MTLSETVLLCLAAAVWSASASGLEPVLLGLPVAPEPRWLTANIDSYVDVLLKQVNKYLVKEGMDPLQLDDIEKSFSVKPALITYHGELRLTKGWLQGVSSVERHGTTEMRYEAQLLNLRLPLDFQSLLVDFDYSAKVMNLGPTGAVDAKISGMQVFVDITVDTKNVEVILQDFKITNTGSISVRFSGHPIIDWLSNLLSKLVTTLLHSTVQGIIESQVKDIVVQSIRNINSIIADHKNDVAHGALQLDDVTRAHLYQLLKQL